MDASEPTVADLAAAILDGTSVDWRKVQSIANETEDEPVAPPKAIRRAGSKHARRIVKVDASTPLGQLRPRRW